MLLKKKWLGILLLLNIVCTGIVHFSCGNNSLAGPSVVGNPSVSATIVDEEGIPLKKVPVILLPVNHNIVRDSNLNKFAQGVTDDNGSIHLVNLQFRSDSVFNLTSTDIRYRYRLIKRIRSADTATTTDNSIVLSTIKLVTPGAIKIKVDSLSFKTGYVLTIPGTSIVETVTSPGTYILSAPAGAYTVNYISTSPLANTETTMSKVTVSGMDTATITVNNFITTKTVSSVLLKDLQPDTQTIYTNADTIGPNHLDTILTSIDTNPQQYTIIKTDTISKKDTVQLGRSTRTRSDTFNLIHDTLITIDTLKKSDSTFTVHNTYVYSKYNREDSVFTIDTIMERNYGYYVVYKRPSSTFLIRRLIQVYSFPVLQPSLCMQYTYLDTILSINTNKTFDTTKQGDTIYFRDSSRSFQKSVILDTIKRGDTTFWKDTIFTTDSITQDSSKVIIDTIAFRDSLRNVITNIRSGMKTITDTVLFRSDTIFSMWNSPDTIRIPVTYYDFHSDGSNPEFEQPHPTGIKKGMVNSLLDASGKPVAGSNIMMNAYMKYWFRFWADSTMNRDSTSPIYNSQTGALTGIQMLTHDTAFKNIVIKDSLMFVKVSGSNIYRYDNLSFFPLDNRGFGNETNSHNYSFTMQMDMNVYMDSDTSKIAIRGNDDIWVFVNNTLAIDLGGIHEAATDSCLLVETIISGEKKPYLVSLFLAERHSVESNLRIELAGLRPR
jgi:fibro-slime domain-containing protein